MLERLDGLIRCKATGDRESLANRLQVSVRTVTNLKLELEALGAVVRFDKCSNSYVYEEQVTFNWSIVLDTDNLGMVQGGAKNSSELLPEGRIFAQAGAKFVISVG